MASEQRSGAVVAELLRLGIVLLMTAAGFAVGVGVDAALDLDDVETTRLVTSVLGALGGYLLGGVIGRAVVRGVDSATERLAQVPAAQLVAAGIGAGVGGFVGVAVLLPVLLLPFQRYTVPVTLLIVLVLAYAGGRLGASRGADLGRYIGVRGRLEVRTPSRGTGIRVMDSSALVDGRVVAVARAGFLDGTLVVPTYVLDEVQRLADSGSDHRRRAGRRGLSTVQRLQDEGLAAVEITDDTLPPEADVDAALVAMCRERRASLVTTDINLARVAEIGGVRVLNLHVLADAVRPPVLPGDKVELALIKRGREAEQAVGYLDDGTMVVVDGAADRIGSTVPVDVTSIVQNRQGRMLFGAIATGEGSVAR